MATIMGTALDDSLMGVAGQSDTLYGLAGNDTLTGGDELVAPIARVSTNGASRGPSVSADGRYVLFEGGPDLLPGETSPLAGLFLKDMATGSIARAGTTAAGVQPLYDAYGTYLELDYQ